jgi:glycosyltransferase involved in cell wall biosynthesis
VLPSRSEGLGRVLVDALCRGRPVVASLVVGIRDVLEDGVSAILVEPRDRAGLTEALVRVLADRALAECMAEAARAQAERWLATPEQFAERLATLVTALSGNAASGGPAAVDAAQAS